MQIEYSVVVPFKNEEENIIDLITELRVVMRALGQPWELISVDDGSTDSTRELLRQQAKEVPQVRVLYFNRNYGQSSAFDAGFKAAKGKYVITLDGDRQNDPEDIPKLLAAAQTSAADLVCGYRVNRKDTIVKKITSRLANAVRKRFCHDGVRDTGCSLKVYRRESLSKIKMYTGLHRFLPALFLIEGMRIIEVPVTHRERVKGKSNYNFFNRSFNTIFDMFAVRWMYNRSLRYCIEEELP